MVEDAGLLLLITDRRLAEQSPVEGVKQLYLEDEGALAGLPDTNPPSAAGPEDLAYVIYTSGSTGQPKGVMVRHAAVVNFLASMRRTPGLSSTDVLLAVTSLSFDIHVLELLLPLSVGARIELLTRAEAGNGPGLRRALAERGVTVLQATPATWRLLLEAGWQGEQSLKALCGGEALPPELAAKLLPCASELWNLYGPTETTVWSTVQQVSTVAGPISVGSPIANTQVYVLDRLLRPVPPGVPGSCTSAGRGWRGAT